MASPMPHVGSSELADIALCIGVGRNGKLDGQRQLSLNEFRAYGQIQVRAQQQNDHGRTPYPGINGVYRLDNRIHKTAPLSSRTRSALRCIDCPAYGFLICYSRVLKRHRPTNGGALKGRTRERIGTRTSRLMAQAPSRTQRSALYHDSLSRRFDSSRGTMSKRSVCSTSFISVSSEMSGLSFMSPTKPKMSMQNVS